MIDPITTAARRALRYDVSWAVQQLREQTPEIIHRAIEIESARRRPRSRLLRRLGTILEDKK